MSDLRGCVGPLLRVLDGLAGEELVEVGHHTHRERREGGREEGGRESTEG